jgi:disulfide bond formation protein DsbB
MTELSHRTVALLGAMAAAAALGIAFASESWGGLAPCALCLLARWPYRIAIGIGLLAAVAPARIGRPLIALLVVALLADVAVSVAHVGVEHGWWPSPLPECAAPKFAGGSIADRLASMPARPAKPCDEPTYLVPFLPVSMAGLNLLFALACAAGLTWFLSRRISRP